MIGTRGHYGLVLEGLKKIPSVRLLGIAPGNQNENMEELIKLCKRENHSPTLFEDYRKMLDKIKPDAVSICGPYELHAQMSMEAFDRNIAVFCEKPVATTLDDLARLKTSHAGPNVHFAAMMALRYDPAFYTAWNLVQEGAIGKVRLLNTQKSYKLGKRGLHKRETYSGTIPWVGSHAIDLIRWFSGEPFISVSAVHTTKENREHGDLEISALCQFRMADDVFASASLDFFRPGNAPTHGDDRVRAIGTKGVIEVRGDEVFLINEKTKGEEKIKAACDRDIFQDFVEHIRNNKTTLLVAEDTFSVTEACLLARQSADENRIITF
jgi:predicted dehydrogenase